MRGWVTAWRARLPNAIGTPDGVCRPVLPAWPFLVIATFALAASLVVFPPAGPRSWLAALLAVGICLPALLAQRLPLAAGLAAGVLNLVMAFVLVAALPREVVSPPWFLNAAPPQLAAAYTIGFALPVRAVVVALAGVVASGVVFVLAVGRVPLPAELWTWAALLVVAALLGIRQKERHARALRWIADGAQRRVQDERDRIARELHDVVAHHMSVIAVRAVSASRRIPDVSDAAAREFADLGTGAREALGELRQLLGVLRDDTGPELEPQPGLGDLSRLAERTRGAGSSVALSVAEPSGVPAAAAVSAYRIVQEALSNVSRHATGARVHVRVGPDEGGTQLVVEVVNDPPPGPSAPGVSGGHGLDGMRERARLLGGACVAGPTPSGGFRVRAELPLRMLS
ncbi:sensor histidine kinase [Pseudonocardia kunmingensis]|uniref:histidine kinase n=1 Tax=Pseudonocardia kunmingensis TaxID=630975 RepID=A0A543E2E3_9PSEU|nr:histidine kinase [Pseudonocardia kunmingensis]TQM15754.1 signal transduction histidine kinase [Pseudonocardia kunmingensis]